MNGSLLGAAESIASLGCRSSERLSEDGSDDAPGYISFSAQDWWYHNRAHSDFQLMRRIARRRKVLFVNSITMRMPLPGRSTMAMRRLRRKLASMAKVIRRPDPDVPGFYVFTPLIVPLYGFSWSRAANASLVRRQVELAARAIGIRGAPVVVVTIPTAWDVVRRMERRRLVYNRSDKHSAMPEADQPYIAGMESKLLAESDAVLYVSRALMADEAGETRERAYFLDHGVDLDHFAPRPAADEPPDLARIPRPRIGFFGGFDDYIVDFELLEQLAVELPDAHLVLIGDATCSMARLQALPNVHWLGFRPYEDIPRYGSGFDIGLMPWLHNEWITYCNPIKLKEYLALGLPVVSTDFPEAHRYAEWIDIAADREDFVRRVKASLVRSGSGDRARAAVAGSGWDKKVEEVMALCEGPGSPSPPLAGPSN